MSKKILIVDDDSVDREMIKRNLRGPANAYDFVELQTVAEAIDVLNDQSFDCAFVDYLLPDLDGISLIRKVYDHEKNITPCPIIMLTGQGSEAVMIDAIQYGAQDYILKEHISRESLPIVIRKAQENYDLRKNRYYTELQLAHSLKMDALGRLTGGVAHDFNNLITIISGHVRVMENLLSKDSVDRDSMHKSLETIKSVSENGAELIKHLTVFARQEKSNIKTIDLNDAIKKACALMDRALGKGVYIETDLTEGIGTVNLDVAQFEHALINIGVNARDAMAGNGAFSISTKRAKYKELEWAEPSNENSDHDVAVISLADNGKGISAEIQQRIFEPFFTTKDVGEGTGLGLSMVYGFVKKSGGMIHVASEEGQGACFNICLPIQL